MADLTAVRREAVFEAELLLARLDIGPGDRLDVFDTIEDAGVWLSFEPLDSLFGWYQRVDKHTAGIVVNASHPTALQRFTAAHELGHHVLGHTYSFDDQHTVIDGGQGDDPQEVAAQTFAANLLMPLASVEYQLARLGLDLARPTVDARHVYRMSVEMGVSYLATVVQLASLKKIGWPTARRLRQVQPLAVKSDLVGRPPEMSRAAVWLLEEADNARTLAVDVGDELHVLAPEIRSSGFRWMANALTDNGFRVVADSLEPVHANGSTRYGAPQSRHFVFQAAESGSYQLKLDMRQAWLPESTPEREYSLFVEVQAPRTGELGKGLSINQHPQILAA